MHANSTAPTMTTTDRYCKNCRQMVAPKLTVGPGAYLLAALAWFGANPLLDTLGIQVAGQWWLGSLVIALGVAVLIGTLAPIRSCPICKSANLSEQAPV